MDRGVSGAWRSFSEINCNMIGVRAHLKTGYLLLTLILTCHGWIISRAVCCFRQLLPELLSMSGEKSGAGSGAKSPRCRIGTRKVRTLARGDYSRDASIYNSSTSKLWGPPVTMTFLVVAFSPRGLSILTSTAVRAAHVNLILVIIRTHVGACDASNAESHESSPFRQMQGWTA